LESKGFGAPVSLEGQIPSKIDLLAEDAHYYWIAVVIHFPYFMPN
jgi:hypothetical protein